MTPAAKAGENPRADTKSLESQKSGVYRVDLLRRQSPATGGSRIKFRPRAVPKGRSSAKGSYRHLRSKPCPAGSGRIEIGDTKCGGLAFRVTANGARSWCFRFTDPDTRRDARLTIGAYPDVGLGKARELADVHRAAVARGENPIAERRKARAGAETATFAYLADRYMARARPTTQENPRCRRAQSAATRLAAVEIPRLRHDLAGRHSRVAGAIITAGKPVLCNRVQASFPRYSRSQSMRDC